jgi:hypothetical protein
VIATGFRLEERLVLASFGPELLTRVQALGSKEQHSLLHVRLLLQSRT